MTFNNVSILVPYTSDNDIREKNWNWIKKRYELLMPQAEICIGESTTFPYSRAESINNAAKKATRDIFIIADADIIFDVNDMKIAIEMLNQYKLVIPYSKLIKLDKLTTKNLIFSNINKPISNISISNTRSILFYDSSTPHKYEVIGGICIIKKHNFYECGGFDERFRGWGGEDDAFLYVVKYLYKEFGRPNNMTVYHLFHEAQSIDIQCYKKNKNLLITKYAKSNDLQSVINFLTYSNRYE